MIYDYVGNVKDGSPYYRSSGDGTYYIYFDKECGTAWNPRWIVDDDAPALDRDSNLDLLNDGVNGEGCYRWGGVLSNSHAIEDIFGTNSGWVMWTSNNAWDMDVSVTIAEHGKIFMHF